MGDLPPRCTPAASNSAQMRPRNITRIRSASPSSSGSSEEIITIPAPPVGHVLDQPVDLALRADVDPARRLAQHDHVRREREPAREDDLLLVAAREVDDRRRQRRRLDRRSARPRRAASLRSSPRVDDARGARAGRARRPRGCAGPSASAGSRSASGRRGRGRSRRPSPTPGERRPDGLPRTLDRRRSERIAPPSASASSFLPQPTRPATPTISPRAHLEGRVAAPVVIVGGQRLDRRARARRARSGAC